MFNMPPYDDSALHGKNKAPQFIVVPVSQPQICEPGTFGPFSTVDIAAEFISTLPTHTTWSVRALIPVQVTTVSKFKFYW